MPEVYSPAFYLKENKPLKWILGHKVPDVTIEDLSKGINLFKGILVLVFCTFNISDHTFAYTQSVCQVILRPTKFNTFLRYPINYILIYF